MKSILIIILFAFLLITCSGCGDDEDGNTSPENNPDGNSELKCLSVDEKELATLINEYRAEKSLPPVPITVSLTLVAKTHVRDLNDNNPDAATGCNLHSWSDKGSWTSCCYTSDHAEAQCMWDKPRELSSYSGNGYEISAVSSGSITPQTALNLWKNSSGHNSVIVNEGMWSGTTWNAIGVGIYQGYAVVWFGKEVDPAGNSPDCQ